jgi:hypothetical protein
MQFIWEAVSHELGHTLGLLHDGLAPNPGNPQGQPYFWGQGNWAPIMVRRLLQPQLRGITFHTIERFYTVYSATLSKSWQFQC